jgi:hypothetical protein
MATVLGLQLCKILLLDTDAFIPLHPGELHPSII